MALAIPIKLMRECNWDNKSIVLLQPTDTGILNLYFFDTLSDAACLMKTLENRNDCDVTTLIPRSTRKCFIIKKCIEYKLNWPPTVFVTLDPRNKLFLKIERI